MSDLQESSGVECVGYDSGRHLLTGSLGSVRLRPKEAAIMCLLIMHTGTLVVYERLYAACWPDPASAPDRCSRNNIGVLMFYLRARLASVGYPGKITNVYSVGYLLDDVSRPMHTLHLPDSRHRLLRRLLQTHPNHYAAGLLLPMFDS